MKEAFLNIKTLSKSNTGKDGQNKVINGYHVQELMVFLVTKLKGKGAYGSVYIVYKGENKYAMKEIEVSHVDLPEISNDERKEDADSKFCELVCKEVAILKNLDHPNIVKYFTSFIEGSCIYIVMELVEGTSLANFIVSLAEKVRRMKLMSRNKKYLKKMHGTLLFRYVQL